MLSLSQGEVREAAQLFEKAVELGSLNYLTHFHYAALSPEGKFSPWLSERLEKRLRRSIELNPINPQAMSLLATVYASRRERLDEALDLARSASQLQPGSMAWQLNWASVLLVVGRVDEARDSASVLSRGQRRTTTKRRRKPFWMPC